MIELFSEMPLFYLDQRKKEIERFKTTMFPEIEKVLNDMGCTGSVDFTSSKSSPVGYDTIVIKAKKPGTVPMDAIVTVKFPSAHPKNLYTIQWKDANGVTNQDTALVGTALDVPGVVEVYFKEAFGESSESKKSEESDDPDVADAKERGWDDARVIDLGGKGKHEDIAMSGIKSAIMAAWSGAGVKNFKLDIQRNDYNLDVYSKTLDGTPTGTSWRVLPIEGSVARYTDNLTNGDTEVAADIPYITDDDVERIFTDEFKKLDDDMSEGYVGKEGAWGTNNPDGFRKLNDLLEAAGFQCTFDNRFGDELIARDGEKFYVIEYNVPPDMVVDRNKPWEIFDGDSGEFMKNFADPETAADHLIAKKGKE